MIKIELTESTRKEIENRHWEWFEERSSKCFQNESLTYKKFIIEEMVDGNGKHITWPEVKSLVNGRKETLEQFKARFGVKYRRKAYQAYDRMMTAFGYDNFCKSRKNWNAYELCKKIDIDVCPYCNRQYIFTVGSADDKVVRPEIDHFLPKSQYPYLSCSLYNFIPSCHICNHGKRDFGENIVYPYDDEFGARAPFRVKFSDNSPDSDNLIHINNANIFFACCYLRQRCSNSFHCKFSASIDTFHLEDLYNMHKIELKDLFDRYRNYCHPRITEIMRLFHEDEVSNAIGTSEKDKQEQTEKILELYAKQMKSMFLGLPVGVGNKQYPLRKFKEDIIKQLDDTRKKMKD